ncbi:MAG: OsmC family protein [Acidobacteria bacterium]|nr:OsmC family protein [Acidobacteriota bacterium]
MAYAREERGTGAADHHRPHLRARHRAERREDAFNPAELLLGRPVALPAQGRRARGAPMLTFELQSVEVRVHGVRQDVPPRMDRLDYEIQVDTDEPNRRLELLHENVKNYGTVFNTVAPGTQLTGPLSRVSVGL